MNSVGQATTLSCPDNLPACQPTLTTYSSISTVPSFTHIPQDICISENDLDHAFHYRWLHSAPIGRRRNSAAERERGHRDPIIAHPDHGAGFHDPDFSTDRRELSLL